MKQIILPVTVHLNIRLPLALLQPEPADAPTRNRDYSVKEDETV